jgi:hypothetical protein
MKYVYIKELLVVRVEERYLEVINKVDRNRQPVVIDSTSVSTGWWIVFHDHISIGVGPQMPDVSVGDKMTATWVKE